MADLTLKTHCAHWGFHDHRYFGHDVFADLLGRETLTGLTVLAVLGRRLSIEDCQVIDEAAVALTLADPRIWPLKLTRVLATYGSPLLAAASGQLVLEGARIGPSVTGDAARLLGEWHEKLVDRWDDGELARRVAASATKGRRFPPGFGTPFRSEDERLVAFRVSLTRRARVTLPYFRTLDAVAPVVSELTRAQPNIALGVAACFLDLGLDVKEVAPLTTALMHHMFIANALESAAQAPPWLRELPVDAVRYAGPKPRLSPRALAAQAACDQAESAEVPRSPPSSVAPPLR
jgi:hypothetical protein